MIYANEPYEGALGGCSGPGQGFPNDEDADTTINTISHEHNESITDRSATAGSPRTASENGDLCAYNYGTPAGTAPNGQPYNQLINGHDYSLQQEFSDKGSGCFQNATQEHALASAAACRYNGGLVMHTNTTYAIYWLPTAGNTSQPGVSGTAAVGHTLTSSTGSWNGAATGYSFQWQRCSAGGTGCADIAGATGPTYTLAAADGGMSVRATVSATNVNGASPYAASADVVVVLPAARGERPGLRPRRRREAPFHHGRLVEHVRDLRLPVAALRGRRQLLGHPQRDAFDVQADQPRCRAPARVSPSPRPTRPARG